MISTDWLRRVASALAATFALIASTGPAHAQAVAPPAPQEPLTVALTLQRVTIDAQGREQFAPADKVRPGELLEYRAVYTNTGKTPLDGVVATLPVPQGMDYQARSASPAGAVAATASGEFASEPLVRKVRRADGSEASQPVPYAEYRALRWNVGSLAPRQSVTVTARVRVSAATAPADKGGDGT